MRDEVNTSGRTVADKVLTLVDALARAQQPRRLGELAEISATSKATCRRLLLDLCDQGYARSPGRGLYVAGPRLHGIAAAVLRHDPLAAVAAESLGALARATGHVAARLSVADGRAVVLALENPQQIPLPLAVGDELPSAAGWPAAGEGSVQRDAYPTGSTWMLAAAIDEDATSMLALTGFTVLKPQDDRAAQLLETHARTLLEAAGARRAG